MSIISQDLLDRLNKKKPGPGADPSELEKFNKEYDAVLAEMERKKKEAEDKKEDNQDASHIPGFGPDDDDNDGSADFIPD